MAYERSQGTGRPERRLDEREYQWLDFELLIKIFNYNLSRDPSVPIPYTVNYPSVNF